MEVEISDCLYKSDELTSPVPFFVLFMHYISPLYLQSRHSSQGACQNAPQEPSVVGIGMAGNRSSAKSRMATLCYPPVSWLLLLLFYAIGLMNRTHLTLLVSYCCFSPQPRTPHPSLSSSPRNRSPERTGRSRNGTQGPGRISFAIPTQIDSFEKQKQTMGQYQQQ